MPQPSIKLGKANNETAFLRRNVKEPFHAPLVHFNTRFEYGFTGLGVPNFEAFYGPEGIRIICYSALALAVHRETLPLSLRHLAVVCPRSDPTAAETSKRPH
jgi:hypothetical protein